MSEQLAIKKLDLAETVKFVMAHVPHADTTTLETFLSLVYTTGTFGTITYGQLVSKMRLTLKHVPNACPHTLLILADLLELSDDPGEAPIHLLNGSEVLELNVNHPGPKVALASK